MYPSSPNSSDLMSRRQDGSVREQPSPVVSAQPQTQSQLSTPPLVFTTQFASTPHQSDDPFRNSPLVEPLCVGSYQNVVGSSSSTVQQTEHQRLGDSPLRVTYRTRNRSRSPYITPPLTDLQADPTRVQGSQPYGFTYSGGTSPLQASTPTLPSATGGFPTQTMAANHREPVGMPNAPSSTSLDQATTTLPSEVVHRALLHRCRFVAFPPKLASAKPSGSPTAPTSDNEKRALFIGQVRFETTPEELIWLVHRTSGACASHLEGRGAGCYLLYCRSEADLTLVRGLHKRILFDIGGVWFARTAEEVDALCEYVALDAPLLSRKARLPRDSMVVEELKLDAHSTRGGGEGQSYRSHNSHGARSGMMPHPAAMHGNLMFRGVSPQYGVPMSEGYALHHPSQTGDYSHTTPSPPPPYQR